MRVNDSADNPVESVKLTLIERDGGYAVELSGLGHETNFENVSWPHQGLSTNVEGLMEKLRRAIWLSTTENDRIGKALFSILFPPEAEQRYRELVGSRSAFRIMLDIEAPGLAGLPWELLQDPQTEEWLGQVDTFPLTRSIKGRGQQVPATGKLRLLFVGANPLVKPLDLEADRRQLKAALEPLGRKVALRSHMNVGQGELEKLLQDFSPDVVHFSGHGEFDEPNAVGKVILQDGPVDSRDLASMFGNNAVKLVVLSACQTAEISQIEPFLGVAQSLMSRSNIPAVVAMQFPIWDSNARLFNGQFYQALADGSAIDRAVAAGRRAVYANRQEELDADEYLDREKLGRHRAIIDWAAPVLFLRDQGGMLWQAPGDPLHEFLSRARARISRNAYLWAVGSLLGLIALITGLYQFAVENVPRCDPNGEWNVAVATFVSARDERVSGQKVREISELFFDRLTGGLADLESSADLVIDTCDPRETRPIRGVTPEERAANAARRAEQTGLDFIVYGTIEGDADLWLVTPEFYVHEFSLEDAIGGSHPFGEEVMFTETPSGKTVAGRAFEQRATALFLVAGGLSHYIAHQYEDARRLFHLANNSDLWPERAGREVLHLFEGNAAVRQGLLDEAETAFADSLDVKVEYGRGYVGLANTAYLRALRSEGCNVFDPDPELLALASDYYDRAAAARIQPPTADLPTRIALGRGQVALVSWLATGATGALERATSQFQAVLDRYDEGNGKRIQEFAAEAYGFLGLIERRSSKPVEAKDLYRSAADLATDPGRQALYLAALADLTRPDDPEAAEQLSQQAIRAYESALRNTSLPDRLADYWEKIARLYDEGLGDRPAARSAMQEALFILPDDHPCRSMYQEYLKTLL